MAATSFLLSNPSAMWWMVLRGASYSLWIHFSVVLIAKAGALINQYVSASRKLFSVVLSFIMFGRPFYLMHAVGFVLFAAACALKVATAGQAANDEKSSMDCDYEAVEQSDSETSTPPDDQEESVEERKQNALFNANTTV